MTITASMQSSHSSSPFSNFGAYLRYLRRRARLTQRELAIAVNYSEGQICHLERGRRAPELATLAALFVPALQLEQEPEETARLLALAAAHHAAHPRQSAPVHQPGMRLADLPTEEHRSSMPGHGMPNLGPLIGRVEQRAALGELLCAGTVQLLTLLGPPGVGKTHFATQLAYDLQEHFQDGIYFIPLEPITEPLLVLSSIAQALDVAEDVRNEPLTLLKKTLKQQHCLLILDNIEQVVDCAPFLTELLQAAPKLVILTTSRLALRLQIEHVVMLKPLLVPDLSQLPPIETLMQIESMMLLLTRLRSVQPELELSNTNALALAAICVRVDGLPLALELVASRGRLLSPQELLTEVVQHFQQLHRRGRDVPGRHRTLRAALHWSHAQLSQGAATLFARLSIFVGQWNIEALEPVCDLEQHGRMYMLDCLEELLEHSLLQRHTHQHHSYFAMLSMLREFSQEQLHHLGEREQLLERLLAFCIQRAEASERYLLFGDQQALWMEAMQLEQDSMRSVLEWALVSGRYVDGLRLAGALWRFWYMRGILQEGRHWIEAFLAHVCEDYVSIRAHALDGLAILAWRQGHYEYAEDCLQQALVLFQQAQNQAGEARVLSHTGMIIAERGVLEQAMHYYQHCLALYRALGDRIGVSSVLHNLGNLYCQQNQHDQAMQHYRECLALYEQHNSLADIALLSLGIGALERDLGHPEAAQTAFRRSLELAQSLSDQWTEATALLNLGDIACDLSQYEQAQQHYSQAMQIFERLGDQQQLVVSQARQGQLALLQGQGIPAMQLYRQCLMLANALGFQPGIIDGLEGIAACLAHRAPGLSAKLLAAADRLRSQIQMPIALAEQPRHQAMLVALEQQLGPEGWAAIWQQGSQLELSQAVSTALQGSRSS